MSCYATTVAVGFMSDRFKILSNVEIPAKTQYFTLLCYRQQTHIEKGQANHHQHGGSTYCHC